MAFKLVTLRDQRLQYRELAKQMFLSQFEVHAAAKRLVAARLAREDESGVWPILKILHPFVVFGAAYAYPAVRTDITIGFPTAHGASPLNKQILFGNQFPPVWPHPDGPVRGPGILPLYEKIPLAAQADAALYELLALFDALRIGQARERELASAQLEERVR
ncbi:MAG: hypothetical protein ACKVQK_20105 [Burkholderiales bacterium]